jgi:hypothetical protein
VVNIFEWFLNKDKLPRLELKNGDRSTPARPIAPGSASETTEFDREKIVNLSKISKLFHRTTLVLMTIVQGVYQSMMFLKIPFSQSL